MDKTAIKNYAIWARTKLIEDIKYKASLLGITEKGIADALPQSTTQEQYFDIGTREPYAIRGVQIAQRRSLAEAIKKKAQESDYLTAYNSIIEEVAYTWFNRFIAVRFMEVNDYLPCKIRVLSAVDGRQEPDIVQNPFDAKLDYTSAEEELISQHQMNNEGDKLFNMLFVKVCNDLSKVLPQLFEAEQDYTELLLNISYTDQDGLIYKLVHDIPEDNFDVNAVDEEGKPVGQVEIIGWLYQYYNTEPKNETFALLKKNVKITKERIPSATQLFTPDWIVRYMVENSLGRLVISGQLVVDSGQSLVDSEEERIAKEKELAERFGWKYYLPEAKQDADVREQLNQLTINNYSPETIKVIDPCMGSGHILVYAFDVLMQIYTQMGYTDKDAALSILENNLYGLDIDKRAFQLAYFAVLMKARQYHKFILKKQPQCHIYAIAESNDINMKHLAYFGAQLDELAKPVALNQMQELITTLHDAKEYGSIISVADYDWDLLHQFAAEFDISGEMNLFDSFGIEATQQRLQELVAVGEVLAQKYEVVVTNPPYMGGGSMSAKLSNFVKANFADSKSDLFAVFMEVCHKMNAENGYQAMISQHAWMFLSSFEKLRTKIQKLDIVNMAHLGARAFEEIGGEVVQTTSFVFSNKHIDNFKGTYCRLVEPTTQLGKEEMFLAHTNIYVISSENFKLIDGNIIAYYLSDKFFEVFSSNKTLSDAGVARQGLTTSDNNKFVRYWHEVDLKKINYNCHSCAETVNIRFKWFPYIKGGTFRRWYPNKEFVVNYTNNGIDIKTSVMKKYPYLKTPDFVVKNTNTYFKKGITWSDVATGDFSARYVDNGYIYADAGPMFFPNEDIFYLLAYMNSKVFQGCCNLICQGLHYSTGQIPKIPFRNQYDKSVSISRLTKQNISLSKSDWDSFETSWDFTKHPLVVTSGQLLVNSDSSANTQLSTTHYPLTTIAQAYQRWEEETNARFAQLKANEEELNRIFINIYGLQDELTPEVEDKDVTVRKADLQRDIKSLLSYAVGCMFGRYSLDVEGLAFAGGTWDESKYVTFKPDEDNVIPITDEDYFEDDIIGRLIAWLKVVYGAETLEENLHFIADALGTSGDTARQKIRNYFLKDFFKDHCKSYQKRPIYWLYDSGKQNGFKALIYMHRYNADTSGQVRAEYLGKMEETYESEINRMQDIMDNGAGREVALAGKRKEKLQKQLHECRDYDAVLGHIALASIAIDLDDGVKVNYVKVQTAKDGKLLPILAKI
ncbi:BREX-1 system adenine-specific DNA-methyltransferase PglX [Phascolarctobacterium succinatutens]|uniref:BREX-1 system adenine-specific DNA-methyltransferase PglX n=1 Tax=Phascolarctobacterium succinatutens TaxID=626940 RepID=UPI0023F8542D|nr:BREX-1 system adenine-specific DNA-methyltransferase PglX [Phascolarctobacterium succinatutens]